MVYYGHRYFIPSTGRFLNRDPQGEASGPNLYAFVGNNPVNRIDPLGLFEIEWQGSWSPGEKIQVHEAIRLVRNRAVTLQDQVQAEIKREMARPCPIRCYVAQLQWLATLLNTMVKDADGKSNLELYKVQLTGEVAATAWHARTIFDAELTINTQYNYKNSSTIGWALSAPGGEAMEAVFHEMTHLSAPYADHGEASIALRNAHELDELYSRNLDDLTVIKGVRKGVYPCKDK